MHHTIFHARREPRNLSRRAVFHDQARAFAGW